MNTKANRIRLVRLTPYLRGKGPTFTLETFEPMTHRTDRDYLGYRLTMRDPDGTKTVLFESTNNFGCSPLHAIDSDETMGALLGFLCPKPGDTDREYFSNYTQAQLDFASKHAEWLSMEAIHRFGEL